MVASWARLLLRPSLMPVARPCARVSVGRVSMASEECPDLVPTATFMAAAAAANRPAPASVVSVMAADVTDYKDSSEAMDSAPKPSRNKDSAEVTRAMDRAAGVPRSNSTDVASAVDSAAAIADAIDDGHGALDKVPKPRGFQIVVAATKQLGIGKDGRLPWSLPSDMAFFKKITSEVVKEGNRNAVVMGRRTWESIPARFRPLPGRVNVVLSRMGLQVPDDTVVSDSLDAALTLLGRPPFDRSVESVFVIGGGEVFSEALNSPFCDAIHMTEIQNSFECDTFMPPVDAASFRLWNASLPATENNIRYSFLAYVRNRSQLDIKNILPNFVLERHDEYQYLRVIEEIIATGHVKTDRTGTGTLSKFGCQMRFNLRNSFPLLTTKRVFWRGVVEELLWFISGSTNAKVLEEKGIHIWKGNGSREYLDSIGLSERDEGDLGPVYGFQWRHFGARYSNMYADYTGQGVDQLADVIHKIKSNPDDRRIILSAWNPADLKLMALPPCHMFAQFYVSNGELSCQMYQRSCDMGLGVPFNIASYALLTCIIAHVCDLAPGEFVHVLGDAHVYTNHLDPLREQLKNVPKPFPTLKIVTNNKDIDALTANDFQLISYESHQKIAMKMAI